MKVRFCRACGARLLKRDPRQRYCGPACRYKAFALRNPNRREAAATARQLEEIERATEILARELIAALCELLTKAP